MQQQAQPQATAAPTVTTMHLIHWCQYDPMTSEALVDALTGLCGVGDLKPQSFGMKCPVCIDLAAAGAVCPVCHEFVPPHE
jgi:hypothetical protein